METKGEVGRLRGGDLDLDLDLDLAVAALDLPDGAAGDLDVVRLPYKSDLVDGREAREKAMLGHLLGLFSVLACQLTRFRFLLGESLRETD